MGNCTSNSKIMSNAIADGIKKSVIDSNPLLKLPYRADNEGKYMVGPQPLPPMPVDIDFNKLKQSIIESIDSESIKIPLMVALELNGIILQGVESNVFYGC